MSTATQTKEKTKTGAPPPRKEQLPATHVAHAPRLPYYSQVKENFGVDKAGWNALVNSVYPDAKSVDTVFMVLSYCKSRKLDPFKKPVHIVPMWNSKANNGKGGYVDTVWPGISEVRTTAFRTGQYAGCDEAEFGPDETETFEGTVGKDDKRRTVKVKVTYPAWCRMTVYRLVGNHRVPFVGPKVYWRETYATIGKSVVPNDMWEKRSRGQLEKCAEAAALRKAFPEELGSTYAAEEMEGRTIDHEPVVEHEPKARDANEETKPEPEAEEAQQPERQAEKAASRLDAFGAGGETDEIPDAEIISEDPPKKKGAAKKTSKGAEPSLIYDDEESEDQLKSLIEDLGKAEDADTLFAHVDLWATSVPRMLPAHQKQAEAKLAERAMAVLDGSEDELPTYLSRIED